MSNLEQAAKQLLEHWDTPLWKQTEMTGTYINALRKALEDDGENADYLEGYEIGYGEGRNHMRDDIIKACEQYEFNVQGLLRVIKDL